MLRKRRLARAGYAIIHERNLKRTREQYVGIRWLERLDITTVATQLHNSTLIYPVSLDKLPKQSTIILSNLCVLFAYVIVHRIHDKLSIDQSRQ